MNCLKRDSSLEIILVGALKKDRKYKGSAYKTDSSTTTRPPIDNCLFFHLDNLDLIASMIECHVSNLFGFAPIGKPSILLLGFCNKLHVEKLINKILLLNENIHMFLMLLDHYCNC
ncbi:hypothetical protein MTR_1g067520 [Medicago truncatula]|uniref:Uncharacterized protein n=1 Tax=Medicago truncatula TaxID=3880 RepID=A0A072VJX1_MEDTR|nr:hypothetical protein MTR_1g067520 [Medicago truncatula]